ncbi:hypothetical protein AWB70_02216 [Caballeronia cordobensis]|uniref:Uncharacterized protein n=1 Tax=Caballeronia cordobensis TaxID=1353886 RepID=A0A158GMR7_CABCO|nr:hypothetical protein [Caballeronia cordobensis]SAL33418.1 hypothetical protein AWB70_02216 [Caballeronia cordobensis]
MTPDLPCDKPIQFYDDLLFAFFSKEKLYAFLQRVEHSASMKILYPFIADSLADSLDLGQ